MFCSTNHFLLLPIATLMISMGSSMTTICLGKEAFVYCDADVEQNIKRAAAYKQYEKFCDSSSSDIREIKILCTVGKLEYIPRKILRKFEAAEIIDISHDLQTVQKKDFRRNGNIKQLRIVFNELTQLPAHLFNYTPKIEVANFCHNKIETIHPNAFARGVDNLQIINLSSNRIKTLDGRTFVNVISLSEIDLRLNEIDYIGLRFVRSDRIQPLDSDSYENSSLNCMMLQLKEYLHVKVYQLQIKNNSAYKLNGVEIDCDTDHPYLFTNGQSLKIDDVGLDIQH